VNNTEYRSERILRGSQPEVAAMLGIARETLVKRESETSKGTITKEAELALVSLPKKKAKS